MNDSYDELNSMFMKNEYVDTGVSMYKYKLTKEQQKELDNEDDKLSKMMDDILGPYEGFDIFDENSMEDDE